MGSYKTTPSGRTTPVSQKAESGFLRARTLAGLVWLAFPLGLLVFPGSIEAQKVTPLPSRPLLVRIGYTTYTPPEEILGGKSSLESVTEYLRTTRGQSRQNATTRRLDFDISLGNYYQIISWLESKDLDAAIVSPIQATLLKEKGIAVPLVEFSFTEKSPDGHWGVITSSGPDGPHKNPAQDYEMYLQALLADSKHHPDECRLDTPSRRYRLNAVAHLSTSGFVAPVLYASDWLAGQDASASNVKNASGIASSITSTSP